MPNLISIYTKEERDSQKPLRNALPRPKGQDSKGAKALKTFLKDQEQIFRAQYTIYDKHDYRVNVAAASLTGAAKDLQNTAITLLGYEIISNLNQPNFRIFLKEII